MTKTIERDEAIRLRKEKGLSVNKIAAIIGVSKSTASRWLKDVPLTADQRHQLKVASPIETNIVRYVRGFNKKGARKPEKATSYILLAACYIGLRVPNTVLTASLRIPTLTC